MAKTESRTWLVKGIGMLMPDRMKATYGPGSFYATFDATKESLAEAYVSYSPTGADYKNVMANLVEARQGIDECIAVVGKEMGLTQETAKLFAESTCKEGSEL